MSELLTRTYEGEDTPTLKLGQNYRTPSKATTKNAAAATPPRRMRYRRLFAAYTSTLPRKKTR